MEKTELEQALKDKFFCPARFAQEIESMVQTHQGMNYIDAIVSFCELNAIDLEGAMNMVKGSAVSMGMEIID